MKKTAPTAVAIAHGYAMDRHNLRSFIESSGNYEVPIEAGSSEELVAQLKAAKRLPAICFIDLSIATQNGYASLLALRDKWPEVKIIVISVYDNETLVTRVLKAGAASFLYKCCNGMVLQKAMEQVLSTGSYLTDSVSKMLLQKANKKGNEITDKELHFLCLCAKDLGYKEIANKMGVGTRTVGNYRDSLFGKLDIHTKSGLANYAIESGLMNLLPESPRAALSAGHRLSA